MSFRQGNNMKWIIIAFLALLTGFVFLFGYNQYQQRRYDRVKVDRGNIQVVVTAPGEIKAEKKANLAFKATGRISYLPVKENDEVKKWQTVASLDRSDLKAVKEKELKDYLKTRWDFEQTIRDTYKDQVLTDTIKREKEKALFDLEKTVTDVEIADRAVKNASLYAPFAGTVIQVNGEVNEWVSAFSSVPLVQIVDFSSFYFEAEVDQEDSDRISVGQEAIVKLDAKGDNSFKGLVYEIARATKTTSGGDKVVPIKTRIDSGTSDLKLGWEGDARIILEEKKGVILVPKKAVERKKGEVFVLIWQGKRIGKRPVKLGVFDGINWEVLDGLVESDELAIRK